MDEYRPKFKRGSLPEKIKSELSRPKDALTNRVKALDVFKEYGPVLNYDDFIIGWYKLYGEVIRREKAGSFINQCCNRLKGERVKRIEPGIYQYKSKDEPERSNLYHVDTFKLADDVEALKQSVGEILVMLQTEEGDSND